MKLVQVEAIVTAVLSDFEQVHLQTMDGDSLVIGEFTDDVSWRELKEGQHLRCQVSGIHATRVLSAEIVPPLI